MPSYDNIHWWCLAIAAAVALAGYLDIIYIF